MRLHILALLIISATAVFLSPAAADRACVTISMCARPPIIDGRIDADEWKDAAAVSNFLSVDGISTADPGSTAYITADEKKLYIAVRCPEPDASGPRGFARAHDDHISDDDSMRVYLAPEDLSKAKEVAISFGGYAGSFDQWYTDIQAYYEFAVNCRGSIGESRNDVRGWNASWEAKVGREEGAWTVEMAIPFSAVGVKQVPGNTLWGFNIFRTRHGARSGMVNGYYGGYTPLPLGAILLARNHPVVRQSMVGTQRSGANSLEFTILNSTSDPCGVEVSTTVAGSGPSVKTVSVEPGGSQAVRADYSLGAEGVVTAAYDVRVAGQPAPLISGTVGASFPRKIQTNIRYFARPKEVWADIALLPGSGAERAILTVACRAGEVQQSVRLTGSKAPTIKVPVIAGVGESYTARLVVKSSDGRTLDEKSCESIVPPRYRWQGTKAGLPLGVLPPWTPVRVTGKRVSIVGRTLRYTDSALPSRVVSAGAEMLAEPLRIAVRSRRQEVAWSSKSWKVVESDDTHAKIRSVWKSPAFDLEITSDVEYDGFSWNEVSLIPHGRQRVDSVALESTLKSEVARYYCLGNSQQAGDISPVGLRTVFPESYNMWIGDERRGISLLTESVEWFRIADPSEQVEVLPGKAGALWRCKFVDSPTVMSSPYTARFALHYTPAKPVPLTKVRAYHPMAEWDLPTSREAAQIFINAPGNIDPARGTLEFWVKPTFDPSETYDPSLDRSKYNRQLFTLTTASQEAFTLYYNADHRNFVAVKRNSDFTYPVILGGAAGRLPKDRWSYVALSWGDKLRLQINETVTDFGMKGSVGGSIAQNPMILNITDFQIDDLRISRTQRPAGVIPSGPLAADADTLVLHSFDNLQAPDKVTSAGQPVTVVGCASVPGRFGKAAALNPGGLHIDYLASIGVKTVIFHENWSRYQGYPDFAQIPKLKKVADACHAKGMRFLIYFNQHVSDAAPEWKGMEYDFGLGGKEVSYRREYDEIKQNCYIACVNGPFGDMLLDGIARIVDETGIDGVYMDGTSVAWPCSNPTHPGCGDPLGPGLYGTHMPLRATRTFLKRLRNILVQRGRDVYMVAHTGGGINVATTSLCDSYLDGEALSRFKKGYMLETGNFIAAYMGTNYGYRGEFLPGKFTTDEGLAISLVHDVETRWQPGYVTTALARYEDAQTRFIPYWESAGLFSVNRRDLLASAYLRPGSALMVVGSQTTEAADCSISIAGLLRRLPTGVSARDLASGETVSMADGSMKLSVPGRGFRLVEIKRW